MPTLTTLISATSEARKALAKELQNAGYKVSADALL